MKDFESFQVGTVFNECNEVKEVKQNCSSITIDYPSRLEAMALDPSKITSNNNLVYTAGQIDFTVPLFKRVIVSENTADSEVTVSETTTRPALARHAGLIMKEALGIEAGLNIDVSTDVDLRHCGLGSSSGTISAVATAINQLYGNPVSALDLVRYVAQNHGEEVDADESSLMHVQCIGGSAICGNFDGGMLVVAGEATPIFSTDIDPSYGVVIGVPKDFKHPDSVVLMELEEQNMEGFSSTGNEHSQTVSHRLIHDVMPAAVHGDLRTAGELIFDYRWNMGSISNCSFVYPEMVNLSEEIRDLYENKTVDVLSLSSVGPGFFALTKNPAVVSERFDELGMTTIETTIHNGKFEIIEGDKTNG